MPNGTRRISLTKTKDEKTCDIVPLQLFYLLCVIFNAGFASCLHIIFILHANFQINCFDAYIANLICNLLFHLNLFAFQFCIFASKQILEDNLALIESVR
jgi:hypothetical protein